MAARRRLRAIFLDIDDTLFSTTEFAELARRRSVEAMVAAGLRVDVEECWRALHEVIAEFGSNHEHHYESLLSRFPASATAGVNPALIIAAGVVAYHETKGSALRPFPDVCEVLERLARSPLILGVITAGRAMKQAEKLVRLGVLPYLRRDAIFITEQLGMGKANPKLFARACETVGVPPGEAMYVGDRPLDDVDPANQAGLITVLRLGIGRHAGTAGRTPPNHQVRDFRELESLLAAAYDLG